MSKRLVALAFSCLGLLAAAGHTQTINFVDEQGSPATTLLDNGPVGVRVIDAAANTGPGRDAVTVVVTSDLGGDSETLTLFETGPSTGVFEGRIDLVRFDNPGAPGLSTAFSYGPPGVYDTLHATYPASGATTVAGLVDGRVSFFDAWGRESASFVAGDSVGVRVRTNQGVSELRGYEMVTVSSQNGGDSETLFLLETGIDTEVFELRLATTPAASPSGDFKLGVAVSDTVTVARLYGGQETAQAQTVGSLVTLLDQDGHPADTFTEVSRLHIRLTASSVPPGPVSVQVTAAQSGDVETVLLAAAGDDLSYTGEIEAAPVSSSERVLGDGVLQHAETWVTSLQMDTVTVSYTGSYGTNSDSAGFVRAYLAFLDAQGEVVSSYAAGSELTVRMESPSSNYTPSVDQAFIPLRNDFAPDSEYIGLVETGPDSGIFIGSMPLRSLPGQSHNQVLSAWPGDQIKAFLVPDNLQVMADVTELSLAFIDEQGKPTAEVLEQGAARVRMFNVFANTDPWNVESVSVEMRALFAQDVETLVLNETGPDTGLFEGSISLQQEAYSEPDGILQVAGSGYPGYRPEELTARFGTFEATARTLGARIEFVDASGAETSSYAVGETVRLRITGYVRAAAGSSFSVTVWALSPSSGMGDSEQVTMQKTAPGSTVFEGAIPTARASFGSGNGQLDINGGHWVEVVHTTPYSPNPLTAQAAISGLPNWPPEAILDYAVTPEDQPVTISVLANDTDPDGDILRVVAVTQPAGGTAAVDPGGTTVTYTPAPNAHDRLFFQVTVSDPGGLEATSMVFVSIYPVNDAPVAVDDAASTPEDTPVLIDIRANDSDIDSEVYYPSSVTEPAHGTVQQQVGGAFYTPDPGFSGVDTFSYTLVDGEGATDTATVTVTVTPVAPPRVTADLQVLYELEEGSGTAVADTSGVGTPLNLTIGNPSAVTWIPGGLSVDAPTLIQSATAATKVISAVKSTHSITLEAWVEPANSTQMGPAPVVTVSQTSTIRNFTLGQNGNRWEARVRTSNTNPNGYGHNTPVGTATQSLTHVVYTRDASTTVKLYVNGVQVLSGYVTGTFATWPTTQKLGLAAELNGANPWLGKLYLVAVYNRALTAAEVQQNWEAGE